MKTIHEKCKHLVLNGYGKGSHYCAYSSEGHCIYTQSWKCLSQKTTEQLNTR